MQDIPLMLSERDSEADTRTAPRRMAVKTDLKEAENMAAEGARLD
jgi:hypothetical protein